MIFSSSGELNRIGVVQYRLYLAPLASRHRRRLAISQRLAGEALRLITSGVIMTSSAVSLRSRVCRLAISAVVEIFHYRQMLFARRKYHFMQPSERLKTFLYEYGPRLPLPITPMHGRPGLTKNDVLAATSAGHHIMGMPPGDDTSYQYRNRIHAAFHLLPLSRVSYISHSRRRHGAECWLSMEDVMARRRLADNGRAIRRQLFSDDAEILASWVKANQNRRSVRGVMASMG